MIISASRRTDIPAFYGQWLVNRLRAGYVLVRNPMNYRQVSRLALSPESVECLVFWTKNPRPMLAHLADIDRLGYRYYFLYTLTPYDRSIERQVPDLAERLDTFRTLAGLIGRERVVWRYDPILFTSRYSAQVHGESFARLADRLAGCTDTCIISFLQVYRKCRRNMQGIDLFDPAPDARIALVRTLQAVGAARAISVQSCAMSAPSTLGVEEQTFVVPAGRCIDDRRISRLLGAELVAGKDRNQRRNCGCIESRDIGAYNSCPHHCLYCYANTDRASVMDSFAAHDPDSPLLYGALGEEDRVSDRPVKALIKRQLKLF